jgi:hypothetical protein
MENPEANQLPEVDSLPDGFVEGTAEPVAPSTPIPEQEKPLSESDYKEGVIVDCSHPNDISNVLGAKEFQNNHGTHAILVN